MSRFPHLATIELADLAERHRRALAAGAGHVLTYTDERLGAPDQLIAAALPSLARLRGLAVLADQADGPGAAITGMLAQTAAGVLRLLDRALAAHGSEHGYPIGPAHERVFVLAHAAIHAESDATGSFAPLGPLVDEAAEAVASAVNALPRDQIAACEALADAIGLLLTVYLAAAPD
jgi:hypothetical protein